MSQFLKILFFVATVAFGGWSENVVTDLLPLAVGNFWTFSLNGGGRQTYSVIATKNGAIVYSISTDSGGLGTCDTFTDVSHDSLGIFSLPLGKDLTGGIWGPHWAHVKKAPVSTPAEKFDSTFRYSVTSGHPSGSNRDFVVSPGVGPVEIISVSTDPASNRIYGLLESYKVNKVPQAIAVRTIATQPENKPFIFTFFGGDSGCVDFDFEQSDCEKYSVSSSFNCATQVLRIYLIDTLSLTCTEERYTARRRLTLHNLTQGKTFTCAVYKARCGNNEGLLTSKVYSEKIICSKVSIGQTNRVVHENGLCKASAVYDVSGKQVMKISGNFLQNGKLSISKRVGAGVFIITSIGNARTLPVILSGYR
jgi:hypothetical protein